MRDNRTLCEIRDGKMTLDRGNMDLIVKAAKDGAYWLVLEPKGDNISHQQRKYFFGVIVDEMQRGFSEIGAAHDKATIIAFIKERWLFRENYNPITGTIARLTISLSSKSDALTKEEFQKAKEAIQQWAAEHLNIVIPDPNE